ncbi:helix-turn-helix domain-containing protein [Streptomyces hokutonensis]|uniref:helix-turn-helix domain-containing protein n=1 Tax=Streptomyces hokutonensis TaxID=1306990 RepID=UPI00035DBD9A|nr:helix-turn-helix domain-containing protein [Streptomyces hokutonensis]
MSTLSRDTRRIVVAHLTARGMIPAEIASELGVSRDTVRRDLAETPPQAPAPADPVAAPPAPGLLLPESTQLRQDLNVLAAAYKAQREDVARSAIHQAAQAVRARVHARFAPEQVAQEARS